MPHVVQLWQSGRTSVPVDMPYKSFLQYLKGKNISFNCLPRGRNANHTIALYCATPIIMIGVIMVVRKYYGQKNADDACIIEEIDVATADDEMVANADDQPVQQIAGTAADRRLSWYKEIQEILQNYEIQGILAENPVSQHFSDSATATLIHISNDDDQASKGFAAKALCNAAEKDEEAENAAAVADALPLNSSTDACDSEPQHIFFMINHDAAAATSNNNDSLLESTANSPPSEAVVKAYEDAIKDMQSFLRMMDEHFSNSEIASTADDEIAATSSIACQNMNDDAGLEEANEDAMSAKSFAEASMEEISTADKMLPLLGELSEDANSAKSSSEANDETFFPANYTFTDAMEDMQRAKYEMNKNASFRNIAASYIAEKEKEIAASVLAAMMEEQWASNAINKDSSFLSIAALYIAEKEKEITAYILAVMVEEQRASNAINNDASFRNIAATYIAENEKEITVSILAAMLRANIDAATAASLAETVEQQIPTINHEMDKDAAASSNIEEIENPFAAKPLIPAADADIPSRSSATEQNMNTETLAKTVPAPRNKPFRKMMASRIPMGEKCMFEEASCSKPKKSNIEPKSMVAPRVENTLKKTMASKIPTPAQQNIFEKEASEPKSFNNDHSNCKATTSSTIKKQQTGRLPVEHVSSNSLTTAAKKHIQPKAAKNKMQKCDGVGVANSKAAIPAQAAQTRYAQQKQPAGNMLPAKRIYSKVLNKSNGAAAKWRDVAKTSLKKAAAGTTASSQPETMPHEEQASGSKLKTSKIPASTCTAFRTELLNSEAETNVADGAQAKAALSRIPCAKNTTIQKCDGVAKKTAALPAQAAQSRFEQNKQRAGSMLPVKPTSSNVLTKSNVAAAKLRDGVKTTLTKAAAKWRGAAKTALTEAASGTQEEQASTSKLKTSKIPASTAEAVVGDGPQQASSSSAVRKSALPKLKRSKIPSHLGKKTGYWTI